MSSTNESSSNGGGIGLGTIVWFFIIPAILVYFNEAGSDKIGEFLILLIWLIILSIVAFFTIIGWMIFADTIGPFLTSFISTAGLEGVFGTYLAIYLWISVAVTLVVVFVIGFVIVTIIYDI